MTIHSFAPSSPTWPNKVPPASVAKQQPGSLPPLAHATNSPRSPQPNSTLKSSTIPYLTYNRSPAPLNATRTSSAPIADTTPGLYHSQPVAAATSQQTSAATGKPRWFTNRLTLTAAVDERVDFTRYSGHTSLPDNTHGRKWTRDDMLEEIYAKKRHDMHKLAQQRTRLNAQLANRHVHKQYAASREDLLTFFQSPDCGLFVGARSVIAVKDRELDRLIEVGGEEVVDWSAVCGGVVAGVGKRFMVLVRRINECGMRFESFKELIVAMRMTRAELEEAAAQAQAQQPTSVEEAQPEEPTEQADEADTQPEEQSAPQQQPAAVTAQPTEAEPVAVEPPSPAAPEQSAQPEEAEAEAAEAETEDKETVKADEPFVLPEDSRNRNHSISQSNHIRASSNAADDDDAAGEVQPQQHARHNTMAEGQQSAAEGEKLSVGSLMEKLAELEEEQDGEDTGDKAESAAASEDTE